MSESADPIVEQLLEENKALSEDRHFYFTVMGTDEREGVKGAMIQLSTRAPDGKIIIVPPVFVGIADALIFEWKGAVIGEYEYLDHEQMIDDVFTDNIEPLDIDDNP